MRVGGLFLPLVFAAGAISFLSPCVLPLVPGYLSMIGAVGVRRDAGGTQTSRALGASVLFLGGFLTVFVALGASASIAGALLADHRALLDRASGVFIAIMGLVLLGVVRIRVAPRLGRFAAVVADRTRRRGGPVALGIAFAFCWTPCVGPILASVLVYSATAASLRQGVLLLVVYGIGLATPFLVLGVLFSRGLGAIGRAGRHYRAFQRSSGVLLVVMGALVFTSRLWWVNAYAQRALSSLGLDWWTVV